MIPSLTSRGSFLIAVCAVTASALAGPEFDEGGIDAGSNQGTARVVSATQGSQVTRIRGGTSSAALVGAPDREDMYLVKTGADVSTFVVDMNMGPGGAAAWGARLTLFEIQSASCWAGTHQYTFSVARPVATVTKFSSGQPYPILRGASAFANDTGVLLSELLEPNSYYLVAVSGALDMPQGSYSSCDTGDPMPFFTGAAEFGMSRAGVEHEMYARHTGWSGAGSAGGSYAMPTTGIYPIPASYCASPVEVNLPTWERTFDFNFAPAVTSTYACGAEVVVREFFYLWTACGSGQATVSTSGGKPIDTTLEVFEVDTCNSNPCDATQGAPIACSNAPEGSWVSVLFNAVEGTQYLVRLGYIETQGAFMQGDILFECNPAPPPAPPADLNGDGLVNGADLAILLGSWSY